MSFFDKLAGRMNAPRLTRGRITLALLVALAADGLQIPFVVPPGPEIIDVIAMLLTVWLLGFHVLLLPTFVVEFIPVVGMLPTWTACVGAVIALRKRAEGKAGEKLDETVSLPPSSTAPAQLSAANPPATSSQQPDLPPSNSISNPS